MSHRGFDFSVKDKNTLKYIPCLAQQPKFFHPVKDKGRNPRKSKLTSLLLYRVFSHDVTATILVSQNNETAAMFVSQTSPVGVELVSYVNASFCSN